MRQPLWKIALAALAFADAACSGDDWRPGTGVGNPGSTRLDLAAVEGGSTQSARVQVDALVADRCNGTRTRSVVDDEVDLQAAPPIELGGGPLCGMELVLTPPLVWRGVLDGGGELTLDVPVGTVRVTPAGGLVVSGQAFILELGAGSWLDATDVREGLEERAADALETRSALFEDEDEDGVLDESERESGAQARGEDFDDDDDDDDEEEEETDDDDTGT